MANVAAGGVSVDNRQGPPLPRCCKAWVQREPQALEMYQAKAWEGNITVGCVVEPLGGVETARSEWIEA